MLDIINDVKFNIFENHSILTDQLIPLIKDNRIIPFVGAGMSKDIYGSWGDALRKMMAGNFGGREAEAANIEDQIAEGDYEAAAQIIYGVLHKTPFHDRLVALFKEALITDEQLQKMAVSYLPEIFKKSLVITTNFDKVLERVFFLQKHVFEEKLVLRHLTAWQATRVRRDSPHYLIKIHGCVSAPDEVVITKKSYDDLYRTSSRSISRLQSIISGNNLLFIGCALDQDRTVDLLRGADAGDHYAILPMNGAAGDKVFEDRLAFMADELNMHCIWYPAGEYQYVADILEYIRAAISGQLNPPAPLSAGGAYSQPVIAPPSLIAGVAQSQPNITPPLTPKPVEISQPIAKPLIKGEPYTMGSWEGKPMEWLILDVQPDKALLIAKYCLLQAPYHEEYKSVTWEECSLRIVLLPHLMEQIFDDEERERVLLWPNKNPDNKLHNTRGGDDTEDKLFLLSIDEVKQYFPYNDARTSRLSGESVWWWLRSPGYGSNLAAIVHGDGLVDDSGFFVSSSGGAVRPAFWLNRKS